MRLHHRPYLIALILVPCFIPPSESQAQSADVGETRFDRGVNAYVYGRHHLAERYFTRAIEAFDYEAPIPHGPCRWVKRETLGDAFSLPAPDGRLVPVAEDVRLLGMRALDAAAEAEQRC